MIRYRYYQYRIYLGGTIVMATSPLRPADDERLKEMLAVKQLGEAIGYGNLMSWASALWRKCLTDSNMPESGALVPRMLEGDLSGQEVVYDKWVEYLSDDNSNY